MPNNYFDGLYFERLGGDFERLISDYDVRQRIQLIFDRLWDGRCLETKEHVLEIGCGTGRITQKLTKYVHRLTVNGISQNLCHQTSKQFGAEALVGDCQNLPINDASFDYVISSECIEHVEDPWQAMREMKRVLKPHGCLIVTTPNVFWFPVVDWAQKLRLRKFQGPEHWTSPMRMKRWLKKNGFREIVFDGCHLLPWQIPLAKRFLPFFDRFGARLYPVMINYGFRAEKT